MALYEQLPGSLSLSIVSGDQWSTVVDFDINMTSYTVSSEIYSLVDGATVAAMTTAFVSAALGTVNIGMTEAETSDLAVGTYGWRLQWLAPGSVTRTALTGLMEVKA
jgi:hypothetical protein